MVAKFFVSLEVYSDRARMIPIQVAKIHKNTLNKIFPAAFTSRPSCKSIKVSRENVEKVVKAPKKPIRIKALTSEPRVKRSVSKIKAIPIKKEPMILTLSVP